MSRATIVYISMFILLGAGLWTVLAFGHGLTPPPDVSGYWQVRPVGTDLPVVGDGIELEQSGRYLRLKTSENFRADLKLATSTEPASSAAKQTMRFEGEGVALTIDGLPTTNRARMTLKGPAEVSFEARRTIYQGKPLAKEPPSPATLPAAATQPMTLSPTDSIDAPER